MFHLRKTEKHKEKQSVFLQQHSLIRTWRAICHKNYYTSPCVHLKCKQHSAKLRTTILEAGEHRSGEKVIKDL